MIDYDEVETFIRKRLADLSSAALWAMMSTGSCGVWTVGRVLRTMILTGPSIWTQPADSTESSRLVTITGDQTVATFLALWGPQQVEYLVRGITAMLDDGPSALEYLRLAQMFAGHEDYKKEWIVKEGET